MASITTRLHTTLVTRISESALDALAASTSYTAWEDIPTSSPKANSTITETLIHTVITTIIPHPTTTRSQTTVTGVSSLPSPFTSSQNGIISPNPHRFPTTLVAILLSLFSLSILLVLLIYLRHLGHLSTFPSFFPSPENNYVWSAYGLVRARSLERSKKRHRNKDMRNGEEDEDPIAVAIRKEEQERRRNEMDEGSKFYAPQVRHLVQLMGSKEEIRIDVRNKPGRAKSWRWGRGKGMSEVEGEVGTGSTPSGGV